MLIRRFAIVVFALALFAAAASFFFVTRALNRRPLDAPKSAIVFHVQKGESFTSVNRRLSEQKLFARPVVMRAYAWVRGYDKKIKTGTYELDAQDTPKHILKRLIDGDIYRVAVTVKEGLMHREIASALTVADIDSSDFVALFDDATTLGRLGVDATNLEGYLFPDTYQIAWGATAEDVARMMTQRLGAVLDGAAHARIGALGWTPHQALTLASIVEAEAQLPGERKLVSAVYHNRLKRGMRLEADPTVAYAMDGYRGRLFYRDLEIDSPYNTYKHRGLPPGPICSPGEAAIHAALYPDTTCNAIYFVARGDGGHVFSRTLSEHLAAVRKARERRSR